MGQAESEKIISQLEPDLDQLKEENHRLQVKGQETVRYVRDKVNQLLQVMGTLPLKPEELDDETLISLDPIGIVCDSFSQILEHLQQTNEELTLAGREIQTILDSAGAGILVVDGQMLLQAYNRKSRELFFPDQKEAEVIGKNFRRVICTSDDQPGECIFDQVLATRWIVEQPYFISGGRYFHVTGAPIKNDLDEIVQVVLVYTDITERRQIELDLHETEDRLKTIFDSVQAGIVLVDPQKHLIVDANNVALKLAGMSRDEMIGANCREAICLSQTGLCPITDMGKTIDNRECELRHAQGESRSILKTVTEVTIKGERMLLESFIDISARKKAEQALRDSEGRFRSLYEQAPLAYQSLDEQACFREVNQAFLDMFGYRREEVLGRRFDDFMAPESAANFKDVFPHFVTDGSVDGAEFEMIGKDGSPLTVAVTGRIGTDSRGLFKRTHCILNNITEQKQAEQRIQQLAYYDALTSLPNRALLQDRLNQVLAQAGRDGRQAGIMFLDLDRFKRINDTLGHVVGDQLLKIVAARLSQCIRKTDTVARLGGDEFVILLSSVNRIQDVTTIARKVLEVLSDPVNLNGQEVFGSGSIGIALYPIDGTDESTLLRNADTAMYVAKERGRNTYQFYSEEMNMQAVERLTLETHLRRAFKLNEFTLFYQPQLDLETGRMTGMEALLRWNHPERGMISPATFIPLAEESGLIVPLGEWVLRTACAQAKAWQDEGFPVMRLGVNLSARQFQQPDLVAKVEEILLETGLAADCLELELTESAIMESPTEAILTLTDLRVRGVHLAIDDFGTGYSSLSYLKNFPIDRIKIAQDFVRDIPKDLDDAAIVEAVIAMARSLRLRVIAEGVETMEQMEFLKVRSCNEMQGYYFSKPLPPEELTKMMNDGIGTDNVCLFRGAADG
ncbi:MAG: hypothetical protein C0619_03355 [Desulfuromonas sp.]|nr:MAG: hypothetical protein C0619_03355 [Desulfuromonas sp.]